MKNTLRFLSLFLSIGLLSIAPFVHAQTNGITATTPAPSVQPAVANPKTPAEFFARARQSSDLEAAGIPFHLKATYVATGDTEFTGNGTYEEWWQSKDVWRKEATLGNYKWVKIKNGPKTVAFAASLYIPLRVRQIINLDIFHIILHQDKRLHWNMSSQTGEDDISGIVTEESPCNPKLKTIPCIEQYKFAANGVLQSSRYNELSEAYSDFQPFGKLLFPRKLAVALHGEPVDVATVASLEPLTGDNTQQFRTDPVPGLHAIPTEVLQAIPAPNVTPPKLIHSVKLKYPKSEHKAYPKTIVIVECAVDTTGDVREPFILLSGGAAFDELVLESVRQWKFKPATYDGHPVTTDLPVVVAFRGRRLF